MNWSNIHVLFKQPIIRISISLLYCDSTQYQSLHTFTRQMYSFYIRFDVYAIKKYTFLPRRKPLLLNIVVRITWYNAGVYNSNLMAGQKFFLTYPRAKDDMF